MLLSTKNRISYLKEYNKPEALSIRKTSGFDVLSLLFKKELGGKPLILLGFAQFFFTNLLYRKKDAAVKF